MLRPAVTVALIMVVGASAVSVSASEHQRYTNAVAAFNHADVDLTTAWNEYGTAAAAHTTARDAAAARVTAVTEATAALAGVLPPETLAPLTTAASDLTASTADELPVISPPFDPAYGPGTGVNELTAVTNTTVNAAKKYRAAADEVTATTTGIETLDATVTVHLNNIAATIPTVAGETVTANTFASDAARDALLAAGTAVTADNTDVTAALVTFVNTRQAVTSEHQAAVAEQEQAQRIRDGSIRTKGAAVIHGQIIKRGPGDTGVYGEAYIRQVLSELGNQKPVVFTDKPCGDPSFAGCVWPRTDTTIEFNTNVLGRSNTYLHGLVLHEYAHVVTKADTPKSIRNGSYAWTHFGGDSEKTADCMAYQKLGYYYGSSRAYECTVEDVRVAGNLWNGHWGR